MHGNLVDVYGSDISLAEELNAGVRPCAPLWWIPAVSKANQQNVARSLPYLYARNPHSSPLHCPIIELPQVSWRCVWSWTVSFRKKNSMFPFHAFKFRNCVVVINPHLIAYYHTWIEEFWICVIPGQQGGTYRGSGISRFWRQHSQYPSRTHLRRWQMSTQYGMNGNHWQSRSLNYRLNV